MSDELIVQEVADMIDDPIGLVNAKLNQMPKEELIKLVLIAGNRLGTMMKGGEYDSGEEAVIFLTEALNTILEAYEQANMLVMTPQSGVGGSA